MFVTSGALLDSEVVVSSSWVGGADEFELCDSSEVVLELAVSVTVQLLALAPEHSRDAVALDPTDSVLAPAVAAAACPV